MQRLTGVHTNSTRYYYNGFTYYHDPRGAGRTLRCALKNTYQCRAKIYINNIENILQEEEIEVCNGHNHDADPLILLKDTFFNELKELAAGTTCFDDLKAIYDRVIEKDVYVLLKVYSSFLLEVYDYNKI